MALIDNSYPSQQSSLLSFTARFVNGSNRDQIVLAASAMESDHLASNICSKLSEVIKEFNISNKKHVGIRDNAR